MQCIMYGLDHLVVPGSDRVGIVIDDQRQPGHGQAVHAKFASLLC